MLPGRKYTPEDIIAVILRWKWLIAIPWIVIAVGTALVAKSLPDRYRSESTIQVIPQRVAANYVPSAVTAKIEDRLPVIKQQILSRTKLERIIRDFGLYPEARKTQLMEDIVTQMRNDIGTEVIKGDAFQVSYSSTDAKMAMKVTEQIASLFISENLRDRESLAEGTNQFLDSQLDDARRRLLDHEKKLEEYRRAHAGELPTQLASNLQSIQNLQAQIQGLAESINRDRDQRLMLEQQLNDTEAEGAVINPQEPTAGRGPVDAVPQNGSAAAQLAAAQNSLRTLELTKKPDYPDVKLLKKQIAELEKKVAADALLAEATPGGAPVAAPMSPGEVLRQRKIRDLKTAIETLDRTIKNREENQKKLQAQIPEFQRRVDAEPTRESELVALTRDYDTLQKIYTTFLQKGEDAKVAANLERRQIGEQFQVIDQARLPQQPYTPDRPKFYLGGLIGGLVFGIAIVGFIEYRDNSFRTDADVVRVLSLAVLATIPAMVTEQEKKRAGRRRAFALVAGAALVILAVAAVAWKAHAAGWL